MTAPILNVVAALLSFLLTLMVLSYLIGDNPLFRFAIYLFVGVSAGYAGAVVWQHVLWPRLFRPLIFGETPERLLAIIPLILVFLLVAKLSPRSASLGNPALAFLVGVGAAVAIGGAVLGTLFPQSLASINLFDFSAGGNVLERFFEGSLILAGTLTTLVYFHFGAKSASTSSKGNRLLHILSLIGQVFIAFTLGALFAGVYAAALTALIERVHFIWTFLGSFF